VLSLSKQIRNLKLLGHRLKKPHSTRERNSQNKCLNQLHLQNLGRQSFKHRTSLMSSQSRARHPWRREKVTIWTLNLIWYRSNLYIRFLKSLYQMKRVSKMLWRFQLLVRNRWVGHNHLRACMWIRWLQYCKNEIWYKTKIFCREQRSKSSSTT
jgi:hypothetical protein